MIVFDNPIFELDLFEAWASDASNRSQMMTKEELEPLLTQDGKFKWRFAHNMAKYQNILSHYPVAEQALYNTIYQVAVLGNWRTPPDFLGKPDNGWMFKGKNKFNKPIMHSHPDYNMRVGVDPTDPKRNDVLSIVWRRDGGTIVFDIWKHSEYEEKLGQKR